MTDYQLGTARGTIEIDYSGDGITQATEDMRRAEAASADFDKSLSKNQKTLSDTEKSYQSTGSAADGYAARVRQVEQASERADQAEKAYKATLLDSKATVDDVEKSHIALVNAQKAHVQALNNEREAHRALAAEMNIGQRAAHAFADVIPALQRNIERLSNVEDGATAKTTKLGGALGGLAKVAALLGGEVDGVSGGLELASKAVDKVGGSAQSSGGHIRDFIGHLAGLEGTVGKVAGLSLGGLSLGGTAGLGGAAATQGVVELLDSVRQLTGALGVLPAAVAGVGFSLGTMKVALHGVSGALKDMMADDPKKFLEDIKNMGPVAAQAMLQVAQARNQIKLGGAQVQDSFFSQIIGDIQPLISTWMPAVVQGMSTIAGVMGQAAHQLAALLQQPAAMQAFQAFIANLAAGMKALQPAMAPLLDVFTRLLTVGSSFFTEIGGRISQMLGFFDQIVAKAQGSGALQSWIQSGIDAFSHLVNIVYSVGAAFNHIMDVANRFGGGGLLGFIDQITQQLNTWTQSAAGQKALTDFFTTMKTATDALLPVLPGLFNGIVSLAGAFVQLGTQTAPGQQTFFTVLSATLQNLAPIITQMAPAINTFLIGMAHAMSDLMAQVGPQLPQIFTDLANAFVSLIPQLPGLVDLFTQLVEQVGPQLPKMFNDIAQFIQASLPYWPIIIGFVRDFVSVLTWFIGAGSSVINWFTNFLAGVKNFVGQIPTVFGQVKDSITSFFSNLPQEAEQWGKKLIDNFIHGIEGAAANLPGPLGAIGRTIIDFFKTSSPAKTGPLHDISPNEMGERIARNFASGIAGGAPAVAAAAASTALGAVSGLSSSSAAASAAGASSATGAASGAGSPAAPAAGGSDTAGQALLPDNIAQANVGILRAYEKHKFDDNRGLKGLAKELGQGLQVAQSGFQLVSQNLMQPLFQALGLVPGAKDQGWRKLTPKEQADQVRDAATKNAATADPTWSAVLGAGSPGAVNTIGGQTPLGLTASSSTADIQKAIIAAGKQRGMSDSAIQTALAVAAAESGFNPTISGGVQGSAGQVSGLYQQSPSSGWGTLAQVNDPNHAINAFYNAFATQLQKNPNDPLLAAVLTQNPQLGSAAAGSSYMQAVQNKLGLAGSILNAPGNKNVTGPSWSQITGQPAPAAAGSAAPSGYSGDAALLANVPSGKYVQTQAADLTKGIGDCSSAVEDLINMMDGVSTAGRQMSTANAAQWLTSKGFMPTTSMVPGAFNVGFNSQHMQATLPGGTPFNWGSDQAAANRGIGGTGAFDPAFTSFYYRPVGPTPAAAAAAASGDPSGQLMLADGKTIDQLTANTDKGQAATNALLQAYLSGNPQLAQQIGAAQTLGASDKDVTTALNGIGRTIDGLKTQDAAGNKGTIDALSQTQNSIAQQQGYTSGPGALQQVQGVLSGASGAISGAFQVAQGTLDALSATQDMADRLVYGISNSEDLWKMVGDVQKYISLAADVANETGSILSTVGSIAGASGGFGGSEAGMAGSVASLIGSALQGVNAAIDYGHQIYETVMDYVGKFMSFLTAGPGGTPLMGDVQFLLDTNTAQLLTSSMDNPQNQNQLDVGSFYKSLYGMGNTSENPAVGQLNIYGSPGQSANSLLSESMWQVSTGGVSNGVGAMAAANF